MKLFHFVSAEEAKKAREIGRLLAKQTEPSAPVMEVKKPAKMTKKISDEADGVQQQMRDYAVDQLERTHPHLHKKSKHYD
jgi:hypothetical protein